MPSIFLFVHYYKSCKYLVSSLRDVTNLRPIENFYDIFKQFRGIFREKTDMGNCGRFSSLQFENLFQLN